MMALNAFLSKLKFTKFLVVLNTKVKLSTTIPGISCMPYTMRMVIVKKCIIMKLKSTAKGGLYQIVSSTEKIIKLSPTMSTN